MYLKKTNSKFVWLIDLDDTLFFSGGKVMSIINARMTSFIQSELSISYEEASFIKETFSQQYGVREITLMPSKKEEHAQDWRVVDDIEVENVDQIVYNSLNAVDSDLIDKKLLVDIYNNL